MYLSRAYIPSTPRTPDPSMYKVSLILPFRKDYLHKYASCPEGILEQIEYHEHLRFWRKLIMIELF
jgi:CMP-2-keto-3-deoxyoctulosonic acid synthetase